MSLDSLMLFVARVTSSEANVVGAAVIGAWLLLRRRKKEACFLFFGTAVGSTFVTPLKVLFARPRPPGASIAGSYAFPSGHVLSTTLFTLLLAWLAGRWVPARKPLWYGLAVLIILLVSYNRVYVGVHWPVDCAGGFVFGGLLAAGWIALTRNHL